MNELLKTLNEYLAAAKGLVVSYGPGVWEATLALVRFNAIFNLIIGGFCLVISIYCAQVFIKNHALVTTCSYKDESKHGTPMVISGIIGIFTSIATLACLLSTHNWIGAFRPDLAVLYAFAAKAGII